MFDIFGSFGSRMVAALFMMLISYEVLLLLGRNKPTHYKIILGIIAAVICGLMFNYTEPGWFNDPVVKIFRSMAYMVLPAFMLIWFNIKASLKPNGWKKRKSAYIFSLTLALLLAPYMVIISSIIDPDAFSFRKV